MYKFDTITTADAMLLLLSDLERCTGVELTEVKAIEQISQNNFHFISKSNDYREVFDFKVTVIIDPVICQITYHFYDSMFETDADIVFTNLEYNHVECNDFDFLAERDLEINESL